MDVIVKGGVEALIGTGRIGRACDVIVKGVLL